MLIIFVFGLKAFITLHLNKCKHRLHLGLALESSLCYVQSLTIYLDYVIQCIMVS